MSSARDSFTLQRGFVTVQGAYGTRQVHYRRGAVVRGGCCFINRPSPPARWSADRSLGPHLYTDRTGLARVRILPAATTSGNGRW